MPDSDSDSDDGDLFAPVEIGGVDMLVTEEEALAPSADSIESDAEPETPKKAKKLQAPDSWGSRHFSQESDALLPSQDAPGACRRQAARDTALELQLNFPLLRSPFHFPAVAFSLRRVQARIAEREKSAAEQEEKDQPRRKR
jgi:hypothetical protein